jgi:hypothetical protein
MRPARIALPTLAALAALSSCTRSGESGAPDGGVTGCAALFGTPITETGLGADRCRPSCDCDGVTFAPPAYDASFVRSLIEDWTPAQPYPPLVTDPYAVPPAPPEASGTVCAVLPQGEASARPRPYALVTYPSEAAARAAGAAVTHFGRCGVCSTLSNLAVYVRNVDLTGPVRACGFAVAADGGTPFDADVACLQRLGFDLPCAQIWAYNTQHTRETCLVVCLQNLNTAYNLPDGGLNPCLQCDEEKSGPVFQAVAGRTRRNSGLPNAICRPCAEVRPLVHAY